MYFVETVEIQLLFCKITVMEMQLALRFAFFLKKNKKNNNYIYARLASFASSLLLFLQTIVPSDSTNVYPVGLKLTTEVANDRS